uniref:Uncharacterized protein n=1 Tax=Populus alba TaxID=43335 RepID=A0A4U5NNK3_POPAL|nr:hypothetical protein D5086_0000249450 [Populus alba]
MMATTRLDGYVADGTRDNGECCRWIINRYGVTSVTIEAINKGALTLTYHRTPLLRIADLIAVIQSGQVGESGSHEQLMQNSSGTYAVMVQLQRTYMNDEVMLEDMDKEHGGASPLDDGTSQAEETPDKSLSGNSSFGMMTDQKQEDDYGSPCIFTATDKHDST